MNIFKLGNRTQNSDMLSTGPRSDILKVINGLNSLESVFRAVTC